MADGTKLAALMIDGGGLLIDFDGHASLQVLPDRLGSQINYIVGDVRDRLGLSAALIRPDGVVAWACSSKPDAREAAKVATCWFALPTDE